MRFGPFVSLTLSLILLAFAGASAGPHPAQNAMQAAEFRATSSPQRLERGRYLVEGPGHCFGCHSDQDFAHGFGQPVPGRKGAGREAKNEAFNGGALPPGLVCPNLTPDRETGAGTWTDAQFERAIRHGIGHDGRALFDFMPYWVFQDMTDEDVASVIVYLRSLPAVKNPLPKTNLPFKVEVNMHPEMAPPRPAESSERLRRGWYLARLAACYACHSTRDERLGLVPGTLFGGGLRLTGDWGDVVTPNITSDPSGISHYDETMFIKTIRTGHASGGVRELNPIMPFSYFRNMTDDDLKSIFAYLRTVPPVKHNVDNSEPPTYCRLCRQNHGFGDKN
jgi:mono/diheme cytochrome c family protein